MYDLSFLTAFSRALVMLMVSSLFCLFICFVLAYSNLSSGGEFQPVERRLVLLGDRAGIP